MEKFKITVGSKDTDNQSIEITLSGELTVSHIDTIRKEILNTTKKSKTVNIKVKEITMIDLSFLQLLIAMKKSEGIWVNDFSAEINTQGEFYDLITTTGFKVKL